MTQLFIGLHYETWPIPLYYLITSRVKHLFDKCIIPTHAFILFNTVFILPIGCHYFLYLTVMFSVTHGHTTCTKPLGLSCLIYILTLDPNFCSYIQIWCEILKNWIWFQHVKMLALCCHASTFRLWPLMILVGVVSSVTPHLEWSPLCSPPNTHAFKPRRWHTIPTALFETIWNGSVEVSNIMPTHFSVASFTQLPHLHLTPCLCEESSRGPPLSALTCGLCCQAGLLGCEAVLSSMALMQANNIPGQKRMMSSLSQGHRASPESHQTHSQHSHNHHGHQVHHGQAQHSHMGHHSAGSCPPLVR